MSTFIISLRITHRTTDGQNDDLETVLPTLQVVLLNNFIFFSFQL